MSENITPNRNPAGWRFSQFVLQLLFRMLLRIDVRGREYFPSHGPAMLTPNHTSWIDVVLLAGYATVAPVTLAGEKWAKVPVLNLLFSHYGQAIFVNRGVVDRSALRSALQVLKEGRVLGLAPEGTRSRDGVLQKGHDGAAWLAGRTESVIIPVAMWGHDNVTRSWLRLRRPRVYVHLGEPYYLPPEAKKARSRDLPIYTEMIMQHIAELLPPERRGPYA